MYKKVDTSLDFVSREKEVLPVILESTLTAAGFELAVIT